MGCKDSLQTWEIRCVGNKWEGEIGTCPGGVVSPPATPLPIGLQNESQVPKEIKIPAKLQINVELRTPIDSSKVAIGDQLEAIVSKPAKIKGEVVIPKGAMITGRVTRLERMQAGQPQAALFVVGFEFTKVVFGSKFAQLNSILEEGGSIMIPTLRGRNNQTSRIFLYREQVNKNEEEQPPMVYSSSPKLELPKGSSLILRTL